MRASLGSLVWLLAPLLQATTACNQEEHSAMQERFTGCRGGLLAEYHASSSSSDICQLVAGIVEGCGRVWEECHTPGDIATMRNMHIQAFIEQWEGRQPGIEECGVVREYRRAVLEAENEAATEDDCTDVEANQAMSNFQMCSHATTTTLYQTVIDLTDRDTIARILCVGLTNISSTCPQLLADCFAPDDMEQLKSMHLEEMRVYLMRIAENRVNVGLLDSCLKLSLAAASSSSSSASVAEGSESFPNTVTTTTTTTTRHFHQGSKSLGASSPTQQSAIDNNENSQHRLSDSTATTESSVGGGTVEQDDNWTGGGGGHVSFSAVTRLAKETTTTTAEEPHLEVDTADILETNENSRHSAEEDADGDEDEEDTLLDLENSGLLTETESQVLVPSHPAVPEVVQIGGSGGGGLHNTDHLQSADSATVSESAVGNGGAAIKDESSPVDRPTSGQNERSVEDYEVIDEDENELLLGVVVHTSVTSARLNTEEASSSAAAAAAGVGQHHHSGNKSSSSSSRNNDEQSGTRREERQSDGVTTRENRAHRASSRATSTVNSGSGSLSVLVMLVSAAVLVWSSSAAAAAGVAG